MRRRQRSPRCNGLATFDEAARNSNCQQPPSLMPQLIAPFIIHNFVKSFKPSLCTLASLYYFCNDEAISTVWVTLSGVSFVSVETSGWDRSRAEIATTVRHRRHNRNDRSSISSWKSSFVCLQKTKAYDQSHYMQILARATHTIHTTLRTYLVLTTVCLSCYGATSRVFVMLLSETKS